MITIEQLEALAATMEADEHAERARLARLTRAYLRIVAAREPQRFQAHATWYGDEAGHWDNSYPPKQEYGEYTGPRLIELRDWTTEDVPTSGGFYHTWRRVTTDPGVYVSADGTIYGAEETGTGRFGQFAAHPGSCAVECVIVWSPRDDASLTLAEWQAAESTLRALAFPHIAGHVA